MEASARPGLALFRTEHGVDSQELGYTPRLALAGASQQMRRACVA